MLHANCIIRKIYFKACYLCAVSGWMTYSSVPPVAMPLSWSLAPSGIKRQTTLMWRRASEHSTMSTYIRLKQRAPRPPNLLWYRVTYQKLVSYKKTLNSDFIRKLLLNIIRCCPPQSCTRWRSWLRHCATSRKVAGSIPHGVTAIFHLHNSSDPGIDSASNRNEYQGYFLEGKGGRCLRLTTLPPSCADCLEIWKPQPPGALKAFSGL
jgi:hypothetical protein